MTIKLLSLLCYAIVVTSIESARILAVFPFPSISHQFVFRKLTLGLANRGHEITVMTPDPAFPQGNAPPNFKEIDVKEISYKIWQNLFQANYKVDRTFVSFREIRTSVRLTGAILKKQFETPEMQEIVTNTTRKFDLILVESMMHPAIVLSHILKAPLILVSSFGGIYNNHNIMGAPTHPLLYPSVFHRRLYKLSIWEKIKELYEHFFIDYALYLNEADETAFLRQLFGPDIPTMNELYNNVDMLFLNINPIWADNRPVPPNVVYMGGIHQSPEKELPNDLKTYLDSSKHGVIYLSFGTNVMSGMIPTDKIQMIIKVFSNLPYNVLWKWDKDELPGKSNNIKISKWFPQSDLLKHPKVKLFITQAGLQSTDEAITSGVPLIAIPIYGDQWYNAEKYVKHGIGKQLDINKLTEELFKNAVETVITDESYRKNIVRLRQMMHDQPEKPLERAIWWAEYVIRHGGAKELRSPSANLSLVDYYEVKLILLVISVVLIALITLILTVVLLCRIESARILAVFPFPSISHQFVFRKLTLGLANRGHEITVMTPDPAFPQGNAPPNFKEIDVKEISYKIWQNLFQANYKVDRTFVSFREIRTSVRLTGAILKKQFETPEMQEIVTNTTRKFDLILVESMMHPAIVLSHILKAPLILVSSFGGIYNNHHIMGAPTHPLLYPSVFHRRLYKLSIWEKIKELYEHFFIDYALYLNEADETAFLRQLFGPDIPTMNELYNNVDMLFLNINPIWADNRPVPPNVVYMGGIHQSPEKELPDDLKTYLDSSKHGVIYLSFGTNVMSGMIPTDKIQMIIKVFSNLPYNVLWKWDKDELPGKSNNIKISKWFPQSDLLKHPKVKLFITQAGLQSTDEAITSGVPLIAIPIYGDQWYNAEKYVKHGIGKQLDINKLTEELFKNAVETVITDESYRKNILRLRQMMHDQPEKPLERAIWWTEYVIRHGGAKELRSPSANLSLVEYYEVKLILLVMSVVLIALITLILAVVFVTKYVKTKIRRTITEKKLN
ncbi:uncharacterized protein LOC112045599 [Bicyclus anynana]|uniref:Uncharacterized protein LOC112045599 n=1 Tax=Bicyclus anynana TaxID=110368 RepID=A0ABM3LRM6_BICAN|nr:uncharacterized protein LOC112045599 [Bicyclus anynana]